MIVIKKPSDKQRAFAASICRVTNKPLPREDTAYAYFLYIQENIKAFRELRAENIKRCTYEYYRTRPRVYNSVMDDEEDASWAAAMDFSWM